MIIFVANTGPLGVMDSTSGSGPDSEGSNPSGGTKIISNWQLTISN